MATPRTPPPLLKNASFHLLWSATFFAGVGDRLIMNAALPMLGYGGAAHNASISSGIDFFFFLPYLLWSPIAGWLADRLPRPLVMFSSDELRAMIVLGAFLYMPAGTHLVPPDQQWKVWLTIGLVGVMAATFVPAKLSIVPGVVGYDALQRANSAVVSMGVIGNLMGFILGGLIVGHSVRIMILTSAGCYFFSGFFWLFLRTPFKPSPVSRGKLEPSGFTPLAALRDIAGGIRYARRHKTVAIVILISALVWTGTSIYMPALSVVNVDLYHGDAASFMFVAAPVGFGMLLGAVILGIINPRHGTEILISKALIGLAVCIVLQIVVPWYHVGQVIALFTGVFGSFLLIPLQTLLQRATPDRILGRVTGAREVLTESGKVIVSGVIWRLPHSDPLMRPAAGAFAALLLASAAWGIYRYVLRGPGPTRLVNGLWRVARLLAEVIHRVEIRGAHHVPRTGAVILVSNHTAGVDPLLIQAGVPRIVRWMMAKEYRSPLLGWLWREIRPITVDRQRPDPAAARAAIDVLRSGEVLGIFPEGGITEPRGPLGPLSPGVALIAQRSDATLVPIHITGTPEGGGPLGSYLRPSHSRVTFGPPFRVDPRGSRDEAMRMIREAMEEGRGERD